MRSDCRRVNMNAMIEQVQWNEAGLVPAIAQQHDTGKVLMVAWMNREALEATLTEGRAIYFSRSRQKLWRKGEESGHVQKLVEVYLDCDSDTICYQVKQVGAACHTGRRSCFFRKFDNEAWRLVEPDGDDN